jgi:glucokinase
LDVPVKEQILQNDEFPSFSAALRSFVEGHDGKIEAACFGIAGPVIDNAVELTNLNWRISRDELEREFSLGPVALLNDLEATAHGFMQPGQERTAIQEGQGDPSGPRIVVALGTGLGQAFCIPHESGYIVLPSEAGHTTFAPRSREQRDLLEYLAIRLKHVSFERVCSGIGISNIYDFLSWKHRDSDYEAEDLPHEHLTPLIVKHSLDPDHPLSSHTMDLFYEIFATFLSNSAISFLPRGGILLAGGLLGRIWPSFDREKFLLHFNAKGRLGDLLHAIPIYASFDPELALKGAAKHCATIVKK